MAMVMVTGFVFGAGKNLKGCWWGRAQKKKRCDENTQVHTMEPSHWVVLTGEETIHVEATTGIPLTAVRLWCAQLFAQDDPRSREHRTRLPITVAGVFPPVFVEVDEDTMLRCADGCEHIIKDALNLAFVREVCVTPFSFASMMHCQRFGERDSERKQKKRKKWDAQRPRRRLSSDSDSSGGEDEMIFGRGTYGSSSEDDGDDGDDGNDTDNVGETNITLAWPWKMPPENINRLAETVTQNYMWYAQQSKQFGKFFSALVSPGAPIARVGFQHFPTTKKRYMRLDFYCASDIPLYEQVARTLRGSIFIPFLGLKIPLTPSRGVMTSQGRVSFIGHLKDVLTTHAMKWLDPLSMTFSLDRIPGRYEAIHWRDVKFGKRSIPWTVPRRPDTPTYPFVYPVLRIAVVVVSEKDARMLVMAAFDPELADAQSPEQPRQVEIEGMWSTDEVTAVLRKHRPYLDIAATALMSAVANAQPLKSEFFLEQVADTIRRFDPDVLILDGIKTDAFIAMQLLATPRINLSRAPGWSGMATDQASVAEIPSAVHCCPGRLTAHPLIACKNGGVDEMQPRCAPSFSELNGVVQ